MTTPKRPYLNARERMLLAEGMFFGGWEDADPERIVLAPLEKFDCEPLRRMRMGQPEWVPEELMRMQLGKAMAGAPRSEQVDTHVLRKALQRGRLGRRQRRCVDEMVASFRTWEMHLPFTAWGLSIFELARVATKTYGGRHRWSPWLNLWADDPDRTLPAPPRRRPWDEDARPTKTPRY